MRRVSAVLLAATALGWAAAQPAAAADLPVKARPFAPAVAAFSCTGLYVGGHLGAGWSRNRYTDRSDTCFDGFGCLSELGLGSDLGSHNGLGFLGGAQIGVN